MNLPEAEELEGKRQEFMDGIGMGHLHPNDILCWLVKCMVDVDTRVSALEMKVKPKETSHYDIWETD